MYCIIIIIIITIVFSKGGFQQQRHQLQSASDEQNAHGTNFKWAWAERAVAMQFLPLLIRDLRSAHTIIILIAYDRPAGPPLYPIIR